MSRWTKFLTREGDHFVDTLTDVVDAKTGKVYSADSAPFDVAVLIPPYAVKAVRAGQRKRSAPPLAKQLMRVRA